MHPDMLNLLELQARDLTLLEADRLLDAVLGELEELDQQLAQQEKAVEQANQAVAGTKHRRDESDAKLAGYRKLEDRGKQRLEACKTPKEVQAVMVELDLARSALAKEEAEWMKLSETLGAQESTARELETRLAQFRDSQVTARGEIDLRRADADARREAALAARDASAGEVNRALRARYERLRTAKSFGVVVSLMGSSCGACFTTVPMNRRSQIRAGTLIDTCESCGVILYAAETEAAVE